jgi:uncharacterized protein (DUF2147 family)
LIALFALLTLFGWNTTPNASHSNLDGNWRTSNQSVVRVYDCNSGQLCARVITVGPKNKPKHDVNNPDTSLRNRPICGLTIGTGFKPEGEGKAADGKIYDPETGKTYSAKMKAEGDALKVRGFIGFSMLGRTETWHRTDDGAAPCSS